MKKLDCKNNLLTRLETGNLELLESLFTCGNRLTRLDLSSNNRLTRIGIDNMPMLEEVCVWTTPFPPSWVTVIAGYSPNVRYVENCRAR